MSDSTPSAASERRRLAAVVFTDVVGYSARMQRDEAATNAAVEKDLERIRSLCVEYGGEVLNSMGDGLMLCFPSAVKALDCALTIQAEFGARLSSSPDSLAHRIGVHLGDVLSLENGSVAGDGVNIASRLEAKAPPGGICISQTVYDTVRGKVPMQATFVGPEKFKNIAEPIPVWHVRSMDMRGPSKLTGKLRGRKRIVAAFACACLLLAGIAGYWSAHRAANMGAHLSAGVAPEATAGPLSIAVLPFANLTGDPGQDYVANGLTASLTGDLSRIRDAFVVNAATAFTYKDKPATAQQVGKDLGVRFVLQGSVQRSGGTIRINAQLADAMTSAQLWSEHFEGDQSDLFALQDQVTTRIGNSIGREMVVTAARESERRKSDPTAVDRMLRARAMRLRPQSLGNWQQIERLYREVLALEPNNARVMAELAQALALQATNFGSTMEQGLGEKKFVEARDLALRAKRLDADNPDIYVALGIYAQAHDDFAGWRRAAQTRLSLDPKNPAAYSNLAVTFLMSGEPEREIELLKQAMNLDPRHVSAEAALGMADANLMLGDYDAAIEWSLKSIEKNPAFAITYANLAMAHALKGDDTKARAAVAELRRIDPKFTLASFMEPTRNDPAAYKAYWEKKVLPAARRAGVP